MTHVFEDQPDGRQSEKIDEPVSRFRPRYRALTDDEKALHDKIKGTAEHLEKLFQEAADRQGGNTRYGALAITSLEQAVMWAVKDLTS